MINHRHGHVRAYWSTLIAAGLLLFSGRARAADTKAQDKTLSPYFFVKSEDPDTDQLPLKASFANVRISGVIADVELEQIYQNEGKNPIEAVYVFPVSTRAAVHAMKMTIGSRVVEAEIKERGKARKTYQKARQQGRTASLLEQQRPNVFQMSVANILPNDRIKVSLSYTELVSPIEREYELVLPTVVGPRYSSAPANETPEQDRWIQNPFLHAGEDPPFEFGLDLAISSGIPISKVASPSHDIDVEFTGSKEACISLNDAKAANRDFVLRYGLLGNRIESGLLTFEGKKENFFLMMMEPPEEVTVKAVVPREHIFVLDVSGSMNGFPLEVSKTLMRDILSDLNKDDLFNILLFAGNSSLLSPTSLRATAANISKAQNWVGTAYSGGGTELLSALKRALALPRQKGISRIVTVLTDGYVSVEKEAYELVRNNLGKANLFAFGIGSSVNRELIEILARAGSGEPFVVLDQREARRAAGRFREYVSAPVLQGIDVSFDGFEAYAVEPKQMGDLFSHRPVTLLGKYRGKPKGHIVVKAHARGGPFRTRIPAGDAIASISNQPLRHLWARSRIRTLSDMEILDGRGNKKEEITRLGLKYSLMTGYTSFVAVDKIIRRSGKVVRQVKQPSATPAGVSDSAIGGLDDLLGGSVGSHYGFAGRAAKAQSSGGGFGMGYGRGAGGLGPRRSSAPSVRSGTATVRGSLSKEMVRRVVMNHRAELRACYERALRKSPGLKGKVTVTFVISASGAVLKTTIDNSTLNDKAFENCLKRAFKRWTFPKPAGGGAAVVTYPFDFSPPK